MKKSITLLLSLMLYLISLNAQTLVTTQIEKKNAVLEEYTGIHCQYCPEGHAIAQALQDANPYHVVLINIHTGGFAVPSAGEPDYRTTFGDGIAAQSGVTAYPNGSINRHFFSDLSYSGGTSMSRGNWEIAANRMFIEDSPVNVGAETSYNDVTRELTVNVELYYTSDAPMSTNYLNVALVQNNIIGPQQDGSVLLTDYQHNHMLRDMITGQWGEEITTTSTGTFIQRTYVYTVPESFTDIPCIVEDCDIAVFVTESQQEIYSGIQIPAVNGSTYVIGMFTSPENIILQGSSGNASSFNFSFENYFSTDEDFTFTLTKEIEPLDWSSTFTIGGSTYAETGTLTISADAIEDITLEVIPGAETGYVKYSLFAESVSNPNFQYRLMEVYVISGLGTLLFHNAGSWGTGAPVDFEDDYFAGFDYAMANDYASCSYKMFMLAENYNLLGGVHTIFYNIGWTFPGLNEEITPILSNFLDNGGNLFIAGQDLGWDTWDPTGNGTPITQTFYTEYLNAVYQADGSTSNNSIYPNTNDGVFGDLGNSSLVNVYGGTNMYPDQLGATGYGNVILFYLNNPTKGAAVKATNGDYKVIYLGFDPPMVSNVTVRNEIIKRSIDWFNGTIPPNVTFIPDDGSTSVPISTTVTISFDQGIRNSDDTEITTENVSNLITFESAAKESIPFTATINSEKTQIIVVPDLELSSLTSYTVTIDNFENDNNVSDGPHSTTFTTELLFSVNEINNYSFMISPNPVTDVLNINTTLDREFDIEILDINGKIVFKNTLNASIYNTNVDLSNLNNGIYFIKYVFDNRTLNQKFVVIR